MTDIFSPSGLGFFITTIFFLALCGISVVMRLIAMRISRRSFCMDDGFIIFSYMNAAVLGAMSIWACVNGVGKSMSELTPYQIAACAKLLFTAYICWLLSSVFYKLAILALYNRIFPGKTFRMWSNGFMILTALYCISFFCVFMTNCLPLDYLWNPQPGGGCRDGRISDYATLTINMVLDIALLVLPLPPLWKLQMAMRKKLIVMLMFSFGFVTIAVMIWRFIWTRQYRDNPDFTSYLALIGLVSTLELWFGILVANIPTLAPLFKSNKMAKSSGSGAASYGAHSGGYARQNSLQLRSIDKKDVANNKTSGHSRETTTDQASFIDGDEASIQSSTGPIYKRGYKSNDSRMKVVCSYDPSQTQPQPSPTSTAIHVHTKIVQ